MNKIHKFFFLISFNFYFSNSLFCFTDSNYIHNLVTKKLAEEPEKKNALQIINSAEKTCLKIFSTNEKNPENKNIKMTYIELAFGSIALCILLDAFFKECF